MSMATYWPTINFSQLHRAIQPKLCANFDCIQDVWLWMGSAALLEMETHKENGERRRDIKFKIRKTNEKVKWWFFSYNAVDCYSMSEYCDLISRLNHPAYWNELRPWVDSDASYYHAIRTIRANPNSMISCANLIFVGVVNEVLYLTTNEKHFFDRKKMLFFYQQNTLIFLFVFWR